MWRELAKKLYTDPTTDDAVVSSVLSMLAKDTHVPDKVPKMYIENALRRFFTTQNTLAAQKYKAKNHTDVFPSKAHLLAFVMLSAPTKLVDGWWLNNVHTYQNVNPTVQSALLHIHEEEMGSGVPENNHVFLFQQLLHNLGLPPNVDLTSPELDRVPDDLWKEATLQLALSRASDVYIPEVLGYTLGYEQLATSLLWTRDALKHYHIKDRYYSDHISIDNFHCGHAQVVLNATCQYLKEHPQMYGRVLQGLAYNSLTPSIDKLPLEQFLEDDLVARVQEKAQLAKNIHHQDDKWKGKSVDDLIKDDPQSLTDEDPRSAGFMSKRVARDLIDSISSPTFMAIAKKKMPGVFTDYDDTLFRWWRGGE